MELLQYRDHRSGAVATRSQQCRDFLSCNSWRRKFRSFVARRRTSIQHFGVPFASTFFSKLLSSCTPYFFKRVVFLYYRMGPSKSWFLQDRGVIMRLLLRCAVSMKIVWMRRCVNNTESSILTRAGLHCRHFIIYHVKNDILRSTIG